MINPDDLKQHLQGEFPQAHVEVFDTNGMSDHYVIYIRDVAFEGKNTLSRHRMVQKCLAPLMADGRLHAAEIKADVPAPTV
jgi:stress-induced morphogen